MPDLTLLWQALLGSAGGGGIIFGIGRYIEGRTKRADDAKDETIATLKASVAALTASVGQVEAERDRERRESREALQKLGAKYDSLSEQRDRELTVAAGVTYRIRQDSKVPNEFAEDMPTAVQDRADLLEAKSAKSLPPAPPTRAQLPRRVVEVDARSPHARPTDPAPKGYPPGKPPRG